ncbi:MAG: hypothetical protein Q7K57_51805 [Burkholderiaceae bacterium]|nr:hypothetical protein [Burkholderiaceae bacterium]
MNAPRPPTLTLVLINWCLAGVIAFLLVIGYLLDGPDDTQTAQAVADEAEYAAAQADGGRAKCAQYGRTPTWTANGDLICRLPDAKGVQEARL